VILNKFGEIEKKIAKNSWKNAVFLALKRVNSKI
jgi:hypothetical protein